MVSLKIKNKKLMLLKMAMSFLNLLSKRAIIWIFSKLQFFLTANIKLSFRSRNYIKSFQRMIRYSFHFDHVYKNERFIANGRFMGGLNFMEKLLLAKTINIVLSLPNGNVQMQPLESILKNFIAWTLIKYFDFLTHCCLQSC